MRLFSKILLFCTIWIINGLEENQTTIITIKDNKINQTDRPAIDPGQTIRSLFVINSNNTHKQHDQTFILSRNAENSTTDTFNFNDDLKFKITEVIGVNKLPDEKLNTKRRLDARNVLDNLNKHLSGREKNKLRSIIIQKRKIKSVKSDQEIVENKTDKSESLATKSVLLNSEDQTAGRQLDNLEMIPFTLQDAIVPGESNIRQEFVNLLIPANHATFYKPMLNPSKINPNTDVHGLYHSPYDTQLLHDDPINISPPEDVRRVWNIPSQQNQDFNEYADVNKIMSVPIDFVKNLFAKMFNRQTESSSEELHIVGPIPKPLPRYLVHEPYERQLQLPNEK